MFIARAKLLAASFLVSAIAMMPGTGTAKSYTKDEKAVVNILKQLEMERSYQVHGAEKVSKDLYKAHLSGMGAGDGALLYNRGANWMLLYDQGTYKSAVFTLEDGLGYVTRHPRTLRTNDKDLPKEVKELLERHFEEGEKVKLKRGQGFYALWDIKADRESIFYAGYRAMGLTHPKFIRATLNRTPGGSPLKRRAKDKVALLAEYRWDPFARGNRVIEVGVDLGHVPEAKNMPAWMKHGLLKNENVKLVLTCMEEDGTAIINPVDTDCEAKLDMEMKLHIGKLKFPFDVGFGVKYVSHAEGHGTPEKKLERELELFIEGSGPEEWHNAMGIRGLILEDLVVEGTMVLGPEGHFTTGMRAGFHIGGGTILDVGIDLPVEPPVLALKHLKGVASLNHLTLEQIALIPFQFVRDKRKVKKDINYVKHSGLKRIAFDNVRFLFAPEGTNRAIGVDQSGIVATGGVSVDGVEMENIEIRIADIGIYASSKVNAFEVGGLKMDNASLNILVPAGKGNEAGLAAMVKKGAWDNFNFFWIDVDAHIMGNRERVQLVYGLSGFLFEFDANITNQFELDVVAALGLPGVRHGNLFLLKGKLKDEHAFENLLRDTISGPIHEFEKEVAGKLSDKDVLKRRKNTVAADHKAYKKEHDRAMAAKKKVLKPLTDAEHDLEKAEDRADGEHKKYKKSKHTAENSSVLTSKHWRAVGAEIEHWGKYVTDRALVSPAQKLVNALKTSIKYVPVDADPEVFLARSKLSTSEWELALAQARYDAATATSDFLKKHLPTPNKGIKITKVGFSGKLTTAANLKMGYEVEGKALAVPFDAKGEVTLFNGRKAAKKAKQRSEQNLKLLVDLFVPQGHAVTSKVRYDHRPEKYVHTPPDLPLSYEWKKYHFKARDIAVGGTKDKPYAVIVRFSKGKFSDPNNELVERVNLKTGKLKPIGHLTANRVFLDPYGTVWAIAATDCTRHYRKGCSAGGNWVNNGAYRGTSNVFRWTGKEWQDMPTLHVRDMAVTKSGDIWYIGLDYRLNKLTYWDYRRKQQYDQCMVNGGNRANCLQVDGPRSVQRHVPSLINSSDRRNYHHWVSDQGYYRKVELDPHGRALVMDKWYRVRRSVLNTSSRGGGRTTPFGRQNMPIDYKLVDDGNIFAFDIGIGANGAKWAVKRDGHQNNTVWTYLPHNRTWRQISGGAESITVGADGLPWVVSNDGKGDIWQNLGPTYPD